jgi:SpoVK/Ycf46/Vps4 family AAA+-type ATPase
MQKTAEKQAVPPTSSERMRRQIDISTRASIGIIAIRCPPTEVFRITESIYLASIEDGASFKLWSILTGWSTFEESVANAQLKARMQDDEISFNPIKPVASDRSTIPYAAAFGALPSDKDRTTPEGNVETRAYSDNCYYVMIDAHHYFTEPGFEASIRKQSQKLYETFQKLFLVMPDTCEIPDNIAPFLHIVDYEYPDVTEFSHLFDLLFLSVAEETRPSFKKEQIRTLCQTALGMTKTGFETALALAVTEWTLTKSEEEPVEFDYLLSYIRVYKTALLQKTEILELQSPIESKEIGGLEKYKKWMDLKKHTYSTEAIEKYGITPSRGVLVCGVPGTGKSLIAKAAGSQLGLPVIRFDIGRVFGSYIGQSENQMRRVLALLDAMAPIVLMVDEVDKGFAGTASGGGNDGGTSMRVFGTFLTWMQERKQKEKPVFIVFTANRVQGLPPELLRRGRIDELWAVNAPNRTEREQILKIHCSKRNLSISPKDLPELLNLTEGLVGAEIESLVEQCLLHAYMNKTDHLDTDTFAYERRNMKPLSESFKADFQAIEAWGKAYARNASDEEKVKKEAAGKPESTTNRPLIRRKTH